jgi:hypothetical protein
VTRFVAALTAEIAIPESKNAARATGLFSIAFLIACLSTSVAPSSHAAYIRSITSTLCPCCFATQSRFFPRPMRHASTSCYVRADRRTIFQRPRRYAPTADARERLFRGSGSDPSAQRRLVGSFTTGVSHGSNREHRHCPSALKQGKNRRPEDAFQAQRDLGNSCSTAARRSAARTRPVQLGHRQQTSSL